MVSIADALTVLYPDAEPLVDYEVMDSGTGEFISFWAQSLGPQPTPEQLAAVTEQQVTDARKAKEALLYDFADRVDAIIANYDAYLALASPTANQQTRQIKDMTQDLRRAFRALKRLMVRDGAVR